MFTEEKVIDQVMINEQGHIHIREATVIKKDGKEVSRTYHRSVLSGDEAAGFKGNMGGTMVDIQKIKKEKEVK